MRSATILAATAAVFIASAAQAQTATVQANSSTPTLIGTFGPGTYAFRTTGFVSLTGTPGFDVDANGRPLPGSVDPTLYPSYAADFNPDGSFTADGAFGPAGTAAKIGALAGTFSATGGSYFLLGTATNLTFTATTSVYGLVNDTFAPNNTGAFVVSAAAVPESATWGMMILGFGVMGYAMRRRRVAFTSLRTA